jgi:hypothetical protein
MRYDIINLIKFGKNYGKNVENKNIINLSKFIEITFLFEKLEQPAGVIVSN